MSIYICLECFEHGKPLSVFSVVDLNDDAYEINYCPFCGKDSGNMKKFKDEINYFKWEEEYIIEGEDKGVILKCI